MFYRFLGGACLLACLTPLSLNAQVGEAQGEAQSQPTLVISQWKCDWQRISDIVEGVEQVMVPVWTEMRDEGLIIGAGIYVHEWGDEWNVNLYRIAPDRAAFFNAVEEEGRRSEALAGELNIAAEENPFQQHCNEHRDNIYVMGPTVGAQ